MPFTFGAFGAAFHRSAALETMLHGGVKILHFRYSVFLRLVGGQQAMERNRRRCDSPCLIFLANLVGNLEMASI